MRRAYKTAGRVCGAGGNTRIGALLNYILGNNPIFYLDFNSVVDGCYKDLSNNNKLIQAATTIIPNDSLIMPANDSDIISALTLAGVYDVYYTNDSTPNTVLLNNCRSAADYIFRNLQNFVLYGSRITEPSQGRIVKQLWPLFDFSSAITDIEWISGYFVNKTNGTLAANASYQAMNELANISPNNGIIVTFAPITATQHWAFYDDTQTYISGGQHSTQITEIEVPSSAVYYRMSIASNDPLNRIYFISRYELIEWTTLGDSVTAGNQWQPIIAKNLALNNTNLGTGGQNIAGDTDAAMCSDATIATIPNDVEFLTVMGGINDWASSTSIGENNSTDVTEFNGALNSMMTKLKNNFPNAKIIFITPNYCEYPDYIGFTDKTGILNNEGLSIIDYANAIRNRCSSNGLKVISIDSLWNHSNLATYTSYDGAYIHPNAIGGELIGEHVSRELYAFKQNYVAPFVSN